MDDSDEEQTFSRVRKVIRKFTPVGTSSMPMVNDPRFFEGNIIDKRLLAIAMLATVSGLMVGSAMDNCFSLEKDYHLNTLDGWLQLFMFLLMSVVLFANIGAVYIGVAQPYHVYRLTSGGPLGYEMAAYYYLNADVAYYRHLSVKLMLGSLPVYVFAMGVRMQISWDRESPDFEQASGWILPTIGEVSLLGLLVCICWCGAGFGLLHLHWKLQEVFSSSYLRMAETSMPMLSHAQLAMANRYTQPSTVV